MKQTTNPCIVKSELLVTYSDRVKTYAELVFGLNEAAEQMSDDEYRRLTAIIEEWRLRANMERTALENHVHEHGC